VLASIVVVPRERFTSFLVIEQVVDELADVTQGAVATT